MNETWIRVLDPDPEKSYNMLVLFSSEVLQIKYLYGRIEYNLGVYC
jgi:hypothetical protein